MRQACGIGDAEHEHAVAAALFANFDLGQGIVFSPFAEIIHQENAGGASANRDFLTLAGQVEWGGWNFAVAWTARNTNNATEDADFQFQWSAGYLFDFGLLVDIGWKIAEEAGINTETLGALAAYTIEF